MKSIIPFWLLILTASAAFAQRSLVKDIDGDKIKYSIYIDSATSRIVCLLSAKSFIPVQSKPIEILNEQSGITGTGNGFAFYNNWMRAGYKNQFRFDVKTKKIQLTGMSRYEFGNAANDGSGESGVNLLTNNYIGNWNYYNEEKKALINLPAIKTKMIFAKTYLETFGEETYFEYAGRCAELYEKYKALAKQQK
jgi:hypothetical protein